MKGLKKDMSAVVQKGSGRTDIEADYMVGELIFTEMYVCSPGADHGLKRMGIFAPLRRQKDVVLEEYDRSKMSALDTCQIIDLEEKFLGVEEVWDRWHQSKSHYLFGICNPEEVIPDWAIARQEALPEGKTFVVYSLLKEDYELAKNTASFQEAIQKILAEGQVAQKVNYLSISKGRTYAPSVWLSHTKWANDAYSYRLEGSYIEKDRTYSFPVGMNGGLIHLEVKDHKVVWVHIDTEESWYNSQDWRWVKNLPPVMEEGMIVIDGKDVANDVLTWRKWFFLAEKAEKEARTKKFEAARDLVLDRFGEEFVWAAVKGCPKGQKIRTLQFLAESDASNEIVLRYLKAGAYGAVLANCLALERVGISRTLAAKLAKKAFAWRYLSNAGLEIQLVSYGNFNETIEALSLYGQGKERKENWGEYKTLKEALKRAGF